MMKLHALSLLHCLPRTFCKITLSILFLFSCNSYVGATIYGEDDIKEVAESVDLRVLDWSRSVAVQISTHVSVSSQAKKTRTLKDAMVCPDERFVDQPILGSCTAFLIAPNLLLTANHCLVSYGDACKESRWLFDYELSQSSIHAQNVSVTQDKVYSCRRIVESNYSRKLDYAIIELDRSVEGREPLSVDFTSEVRVGDELVSVHSPRGLPLKISTGGVRSVSDKNSFSTNLDLMRGSSGAPIINMNTGKVVGLVAQGDLDYEIDEGPFCNRFKKCTDDGCRGEDATRAAKIPFFLKGNGQ